MTTCQCRGEQASLQSLQQLCAASELTAASVRCLGKALQRVLHKGAAYLRGAFQLRGRYTSLWTRQEAHLARVVLLSSRQSEHVKSLDGELHPAAISFCCVLQPRMRHGSRCRLEYIVKGERKYATREAVETPDARL